MISNPKHRWSNFDLKAFHGTPSYLIDVSVDLLNAFIQYRTTGTGIAWFDEEGTEFTLIILCAMAWVLPIKYQEGGEK